MINVSTQQQDSDQSMSTMSDLVSGDIRLICIVGHGRSGSTLLQRLLGTLDGYLAIGELNAIWSHYCRDNQMCSCGKLFRDCEFWSAVFREAFGGFDTIDPDRMLQLRRSTLRQHKLAMHFPRFQSAAQARNVAEYVEVHEKLFRALRKVSGCHTIIDSSKQPGHVLALSRSPHIQMKLIGLVRDSRACAYSWQRKKRRTEVVDRVEYMERASAWQTAMRWGLGELEMLHMRQFLNFTGIYRYEDFAQAPSIVAMDIAEGIGVHEPIFPFVSERAVALGSDHSLRGNPSRFDHGVIAIRPDMEWRKKFALSGKVLLTALTLPWLLKYRYVPVRRGARSYDAIHESIRK